MDERKRPIVQKQQDIYVVQNPPADPMTTGQMDMLYSLPFERKAHTMYKEHIPAIDEVKFSITSQRGCVGSCAFALYIIIRESIYKDAVSRVLLRKRNRFCAIKILKDIYTMWEVLPLTSTALPAEIQMVYAANAGVLLLQNASF